MSYVQEATEDKQFADVHNPVHEMLERLNERFGAVDDWGAIDHESSSGACLQVLLEAVGWPGQARHLAEVLPHFDTISDLASLRGVLARLNYSSDVQMLKFERMATEKAPCLLVKDNGDVCVVVEFDHVHKMVKLFDGASRTEQIVPFDNTVHRFYLIGKVDIAAKNKHIKTFGWVTTAATSFRKLFVRMFLINFAINLAALAVPIFIMAVYGYVVSAKSYSSLIMFVIGVLMVVVADYGLRNLRAKVLGYVGARFDSALSAEVFQRLLYMPLSLTQNASVGAQLARLRQFEKLRELFLGSLGTAILDLPFVLMFIAAIAFVGGWLAVVPAFLVVVYLFLAAVTIPVAKRQAVRSSAAKTSKQNLVMEIFMKHRQIRDIGGEAVWNARYEALSSEYAALDFRSQHFSQKIQIVAQFLSLAAGLFILGFGALGVMNGDLQTGALIALMALVWRVFAPIQTAFLSLSRIGRLSEAIRLINNMMRLDMEREPGEVPTISREFSGKIEIQNLSFRYQGAVDASLKGINLTIQPGELVAVTGISAGGKSTLLRMIAGLYAPQMGSVRLDGLDIRQIDVSDLRSSISVMPGHSNFFYGTVAQNFLFNDPGITRKEMERALVGMGIPLDSKFLPDGIETRLKIDLLNEMTDTFKQQLKLARIFAKKCPYYLMVNPGSFLSFEADEMLMKNLDQLKGSATVLFTTQRPSHMNLADRVIVLHHGQVVMNGPPSEIVPKLDDLNSRAA
ncbi:MAG: hypothetical protein COB90_09925 [Hyphomicrobiales bacterium]|nr:MAG: hypothetical protein COB90_09925 [Hyphomicrobiales bacterium]